MANSNSTAHTPGPWKVRRPLNPKDAERFIEVLAVQNGVYKPYVADVRSLDANGKDNSAANARLIAAAPEMYEALRVVISAWEAIPEHNVVPNELGRLEWWAMRVLLDKVQPNGR